MTTRKNHAGVGKQPKLLLTFFVTTTPSIVEEKVFNYSSESKHPFYFGAVSPLIWNLSINDNMVNLPKSQGFIKIWKILSPT